jgi:NAD(P)-dependent dehydrogenase (short-subunit alcohol dehydrogenase family)
MTSSTRHRSILLSLGVAAGMTAMQLMFRRSYDLRRKTVFVSNASRGLGLVLAREFAARGSRVAISAGNGEALERAAADISRNGQDVLPLETGITVRQDAETAIDQIRRRFGPVEVLVNNPGAICVGPLEVMTIDDFRASLDTHFWGPYFTTMAVLPDMKKAKQGRILNISSIGGKISVPHLLPYCVGKFALTGFSEGLRSALLKDQIYVTTVCPGLLGSGGARNANFKGNNQAEYAWFGISDAVPGLSMNSERAAHRIVNACVRGEAEIVLSLPAMAATRFEAIFPGISADLLGIVNQLLPAADKLDECAEKGQPSFSDLPPSWVATLNQRAAVSNHQVP